MAFISGRSKDMCQWFDCDQPATVIVKGANTPLCDDHYTINCLRFGCKLDAEPIKLEVE